MSRDILEAAKRLRDASPEELRLIAKHDWDMIREVAGIAFAYFPKATQRSPLEICVRNIVYNVEQNPKAHTVEEILSNLRSALGIHRDESV